MTKIDNFYKELAKHKWTNSPIREVPLKNYTTFKCLGSAKMLLTINDEEELITFLNINKKHNLNWLLLGKGSNCIFTNKGYNGIIIQLKGEYKKIIIEEDKYKLICGASTLDLAIARLAKKLHWTGSEFLSTIPGTISGGVFMNAGAHGYQVQDIIDNVETINYSGKKKVYNKEQCQFGYRKSIFQKNDQLISRVHLIFRPGNFNEIKLKEESFIKNRKQTQPIHASTWGSIFKNPQNKSAGELIDKCGLKGEGFGQAAISKTHGNFIENKGSAKFIDIINTIKLAHKNVKEKFKIDLKLEVIIIGENGNKLSIEDF